MTRKRYFATEFVSVPLEPGSLLPVGFEPG